AAGVGLHIIAFSGTIVIGCVLLILTKANLFSKNKEKYLLQFKYLTSENLKEPPYTAILNLYCKRYNLINIKSTGEEEQLELSYYADVKNKNLNDKFIGDLNRIEGISDINIYFNDENL
ncbi:MAG TPA: hypothetical protein VLM39_08715, partial [Ignavibacteriaceae bacterium]|nr:hypothetical protein [Ignavibacteriaceae bacterium]